MALAFESKLLLTQSMAALLFDGFQEQQRAFALLCVCLFFPYGWLYYLTALSTRGLVIVVSTDNR